VKIYSIHETPTSVCLKLEFAEGISLHQYIASSEVIPEAKVRKIMHLLLIGLNYIHSKSIKHNDLKPENIILTLNGKLKILDFGISHRFLRRFKDRAGTPGFFAPEILMEASHNLRADLFSCGIVMYMLMTKKNPFEGEAGEADVVEMNCRGEIDWEKPRWMECTA
jgi:serine/threonine protein kinase